MSGEELIARVAVVDVNNDPILGASVIINGKQAITNLDGEVTVHFLKATGTTVLDVWHLDYVPETVIFSGDIFTSKYNNPVLQRTTGPDLPDLWITLGRYAVAPAKLIEYPEMVARAKRFEDIQAVITERITKGAADSSVEYRDTWMYGHNVECAATTLTPDSDSLGSKAGWQRFSHTTVENVEPLNNGRLFWIVSQPSSASPNRWAAMVWSPNFTTSTPPASIDVIFFYTPTTDWVAAKYPFGAVMFKPDDQPTAEPDQTYMSIGSKYMWKEHSLIYTLIAQHRNAVLILPLCNHGMWDPMLAQEGVWRLCKEVTLFLHREHRFSNLGVNTAAHLLATKARAGASLRDYAYTAPQSISFAAVPTIRKLAVGFFSSGAYATKWMMEPGNWSLASSLSLNVGRMSSKYGTWSSKNAQAAFPVRLWGCNNSASEPATERKAQFTRAWAELWDMDGFHAAGWPLYLPLLDWWHQAQQGRVLRLCHSDGRRPRRILAPGTDNDDTTGLWKRLLRQGVTYRSVAEGKYSVKPIEEAHGELWSVAALSASYLEFVPPAGREEKGLWEMFPRLAGISAHSATLRLGWSWCVALSDVGASQ